MTVVSPPTMWLPLTALLLLPKFTISFNVQQKEYLADLLIENLKVDPFVRSENFSQQSKEFIDDKVERFLKLTLDEGRNARKKRSLEGTREDISINHQHSFPSKNVSDVRFLQTQGKWYAAALEAGHKLAVYKYENNTFTDILQFNLLYVTNLAVLSASNLSLIAAGQADDVKIVKNVNPEPEQTIRVNNPIHVALWEQDQKIFLSITTNSSVHIYQWRESYFDEFQEYLVAGVKKAVSFDIHGSRFLALVNAGYSQDQDSSFSEILKLDHHSMQYKLFQKLKTHRCTDIKHFTCTIYGENHHFLVVVHSINDSPESVIYKYVDQYFYPFHSVATEAVQWQPVQDFNGNTALLAFGNSLEGYKFNGHKFVQTNINNSLGLDKVSTVHTFNGTHLITVRNSSSNIYSVSFINSNPAEELQTELLDWCVDMLNNLTVKELVGLSQRSTEETLLFFDDIHADYIEFNNETSINSAHFNMELMNIEEELDVESMEFDHLTVTNLQATINDLVNVNDLGVVKVNGSVTFNGGCTVELLQHPQVQIEGLLNGISLPVLHRKTLKNSGNQMVNKMTVDSLVVQQQVVGEVSSNFVRIDLGEFTVERDVEFLFPADFSKLEVLNSVNDVGVTEEGVLDLLLPETNYSQHITCKKWFNNLIITNPIHLSNKINNDQMKQFSPVLIDHDAHQVEGDVFIKGNIEVDQIEAGGLRSHGRSFEEVVDNGVKLTDLHLHNVIFTQPLTVDDIEVQKVNHKDVNWLKNGSQLVTGHKVLPGDVEFDGSVNVTRVNGVDLSWLADNVLRVEGEQEIGGVFEVDILTAGRITSNHTHFNHTNTSNILTINHNLTINNLTTKQLEVKGKINKQDIATLMRNIVKKDSDFKVHGLKTFEELYVDDLVVLDQDVVNILRDVIEDEVNLSGDLDLFNNITVNELSFADEMNKISKNDWEQLVDFDGEAMMTNNVDYEELVVLGDVYVDDGAINGRNLEDIYLNSVKTDEDHTFGDCIISESAQADKIIVNGEMENLDLDNIVENNASSIIHLQDKIFLDNINVSGSFHVDTVNGVELEKFCFGDELKSMKIIGNATFVKGPRLASFNNLKLAQLKTNLWFKDKPTNITGNLHLQNVTFKSLDVSGLIDSHNLSQISTTYLSKSKKQIIPFKVTFDEVTFVNISTPLLSIDGPINGIVIDDLKKTMVLQDEDQVFEGPVYFDEIVAQEISNETKFKINNLNVETDIMLYDQENIVTGPKTLETLHVNAVSVGSNVRLQQVKILDFLDKVVLKRGKFYIDGKKSFANVTINGLMATTVNGVKFDDGTVMVTNIPQNITANQQIRTPIYRLEVKGPINGVDFNDLIHNNMKKSHKMSVTSPLKFTKSMSVDHLNINNSNISEMLTNISHLHDLDGVQDKFHGLMDMGMEMGQGSTFKYFKQVFKLENYHEIFGYISDDTLRLIGFHIDNNGSNMFTTYEWRDSGFVELGHGIESDSVPQYMKQIRLGNEDLIYVEHPSSGLLVKPNPTNLTTIQQIPRNNPTIRLLTFYNQGLNQHCLGFIDQTSSSFDTFCSANYSSIPLAGIYDGTSVQIQQTTYLFLARRRLNYTEPSVVVLKSEPNFVDFREVQVVYEGAELNGMAAASINGVGYVAFSFGSQDGTVEAGWVSIRRFDKSTGLFNHWQHIPVTAPLGVHFVTETSFEPLLLVPTNDASAPLQTLRYDGMAGFKKILKGSSLPVNSKIRLIENGHFLAAIQPKQAFILGAVVTGN